MKKLIQEKIKNSPNSVITYADYMEAALYDSQKGYYMRDLEKIGRKGDFITSSNISDVFGKAFSKWFLNIVISEGIPAVFCEIGAGNGRFAKAFLDEWNKQQEIQLTYYLVEASPYHRELQKKLLAGYSGCVWYSMLKDLPELKGMVFSNELFDALPVHVIEQVDSELKEVMVTDNNGELAEKMVPLQNDKILRFIEEHKISLEKGQRIEIPLAMQQMIKDISNCLKEGLVLTVDYGYSKEEWKEPARKAGSLRGYYRHKMIENVLDYPGEMDITSHVHFDVIATEGEKYQLNFLTRLRQNEFLVKIGVLDELAENYDPNPFSDVSKRNRAIRDLVMPGGISSAFHVIIQKKNLKVPLENLWVKI